MTSMNASSLHYTFSFLYFYYHKRKSQSIVCHLKDRHDFSKYIQIHIVRDYSLSAYKPIWSSLKTYETPYDNIKSVQDERILLVMENV